jgi:hypothetical protein
VLGCKDLQRSESARQQRDRPKDAAVMRRCVSSRRAERARATHLEDGALHLVSGPGSSLLARLTGMKDGGLLSRKLSL